MNFTLNILGIASAMPIADRNSSAQVLNVHGRLFLIDCGEGVQKSFRIAHLSFLKVEAVCISHIHGDHLFGLFGFLSTMAMLGRKEDLHIYAPENFAPVLDFYRNCYGEGDGFAIVFHPLTMTEPEIVHCSKHVRITAFPLRHRIECYGFRFDSVPSPKHPADLPFEPVSYAYCSDTEPFPELASWVRGVHTLYHESTYTQRYEDKARQYHHSTAAEAAACALDAGVGRLLLGHYSSRERDLSVYESEARAVFPESYAADEGDVFEIH